MIYSVDRSICFLHMPKTGGAWIKSILRQDPTFIGNFEYTLLTGEQTGLYGHTPSPGGFNYEFGFIREPVSWYTSLYRFQASPPKALGNYRFFFDKSLAADNINDYVDNIRKNPYTYLKMEKMYRYVFSIGKKNECKNIFKFENLAENLSTALKQGGLDTDHIIEKDKEKKNVSTYVLEEPMTESTKQYIYESCDHIYKKFNYERG